MLIKIIYINNNNYHKNKKKYFYITKNTYKYVPHEGMQNTLINLLNYNFNKKISKNVNL